MSVRGYLHGGRKVLEGGTNFSFALHAEIPAEVVTKWRRKRRICRPLAAERSAVAIFVLFVPSTGIFRANVVYMVLGSS